MLKFEGRTTQKITISGKSISTEFKIFALRDSGYTYNWECMRSDIIEEILTEKKWISVTISDSSLYSFLNSIQSDVI